ncbi:MAG TPA: GSCFA domain-containing protein [Chitinophagaceae bacterium]|nr:GSCFA domain-containing protein [Chitinophagaceae bacterium]
MDFRRELIIKPFPEKINIKDPIMLVGSCFSDNLGEKLQHNRFNAMINPSGTMFNPISITRALTSYITGRPYDHSMIFKTQEWWTSWDHHTRFSHADPDALLGMVNSSLNEAHDFLRKTKWLIITLGSAWVYQLENGDVVANCHKVPADKFRKKLLAVEDVLSALDNLIHRLFIYSPGIKIMFTISPVRHLRDGFIENNRSKAVLIQAVHHLVDKFSNLYYFPSYELVIDDLRDYRFYSEDMVHPNYQATEYVWQKFVAACMDRATLSVMEEINQINAARAHKPFQPDSEAHKKFRRKQYDTLIRLAEEYPFIDWQHDMDHFRDQ